MGNQDEDEKLVAKAEAAIEHYYTHKVKQLEAALSDCRDERNRALAHLSATERDLKKAQEEIKVLEMDKVFVQADDLETDLREARGKLAVAKHNEETLELRAKLAERERDEYRDQVVSIAGIIQRHDRLFPHGADRHALQLIREIIVECERRWPKPQNLDMDHVRKMWESGEAVMQDQKKRGGEGR